MFCGWSRNDSLDEVVKLGKDQRAVWEAGIYPRERMRVKHISSEVWIC